MNEVREHRDWQYDSVVKPVNNVYNLEGYSLKRERYIKVDTRLLNYIYVLFLAKKGDTFMRKCLYPVTTTQSTLGL